MIFTEITYSYNIKNGTRTTVLTGDKLQAVVSKYDGRINKPETVATYDASNFETIETHTF